MKKALFALAGLVVAASALAELTKYKDWEKSPEAYFLTPSERAEWKNVASDEDAEKFVALYYARRGGEPFKQEVSRRIAAADQQFKMQRYKRGADSVRGRLLVVLGPPSKVSQRRGNEPTDAQTAQADIASIDTRFNADAGAAVTHIWTYEKDRLAPFGLPELRARVEVDNRRGVDTLENTTEVERDLAVVAEKSVVNPNATIVAGAAPASPAAPSVPGGSGTTAPPAAAPPAPAAAPQTLALPAAVKTALEGTGGKKAGDAAFWYGNFRAPDGAPFLALQFYLPSDKPAFTGNAPLKFGAVVTDETGKEVESFWEDATFTEVPEGSRKDRVFDRSVALPPGSYKGTFGLFKAEGEPPVAAETVAFKLEPKGTEFEVSPLILSAGLTPLTKRPAPTDPFVFGTEKPIKVEPKGDHYFSKQDSLWYFYTVSNPAAPAGAAAPEAAPAPADAPAGPTPAPAPAPEVAKPRVITRINVKKDGQDAFAPFTGPAELQPLAPGYYGTGSEIPLASFEPGYYTFQVLVRDMNADKASVAYKGHERKQDFVVLMADGSLPPKKAPAPPKKP